MQKASNENAAPDQPVEQGDSAVSRVLSEVWGDIRSLVRVKKIDLSEQSLLKPDMKIHVVENLKLALFTAQSAVIRSDQQLYQGNLEYVEDAIGQHFSPDSSSVVEFSNEIRELIATDILLDIPDLSRSIELLRQALKSVSRNNAMFYLILLLILSVIVSVITIYVIGEPGYIFLQWSDWQVETSLILVVVAIFIVVIVLYLLFELVIGIFGIPGRIGRSLPRIQRRKKIDKDRPGFQISSFGRLGQSRKVVEQYGEAPA